MSGTGSTGGVPGGSLATLCLPPTASAQDVRRAFRSLMRQLHPDASGSNSSAARLSAVVDAYRDLTASGFLDDRTGSGSRRNGQLLDVLA